MARDFGGAKKTRKIQTFALLGFDITGACILLDVVMFWPAVPFIAVRPEKQ